jgi:peroxiredoxin
MEMKSPMSTPELAKDFELTDTQGRALRLSDYQGVKHVVLIFNRGFV